MPISIWWLIPTFVALVGALMLFGGIGRVFKAKFSSGIFRVVFGGVALAGAAIFGLIGLNLQTYAQLTKERLAGQVVLTKSAGDLKPSTLAWFESAKNYALYANQGGFYDDVLAHLGIKK